MQGRAGRGRSIWVGVGLQRQAGAGAGAVVSKVGDLPPQERFVKPGQGSAVASQKRGA